MNMMRKARMLMAVSAGMGALIADRFEVNTLQAHELPRQFSRGAAGSERHKKNNGSGRITGIAKARRAKKSRRHAIARAPK